MVANTQRMCEVNLVGADLNTTIGHLNSVQLFFKTQLQKWAQN
jgi:hypothetical protein